MKKVRFVSFLGSLIFATALCSAQQAQAPSHPNLSTQKLKTGVPVDRRVDALESKLIVIELEVDALRDDQKVAQEIKKMHDLVAASTGTCNTDADDLPSNFLEVTHGSDQVEGRLDILACLLIREHGARVQAEQKLAAAGLALALINGPGQGSRDPVDKINGVDALRSKLGQAIDKINELGQFKQHVCASFRYSPPSMTLAGNELRFACN